MSRRLRSVILAAAILLAAAAHSSAGPMTFSFGASGMDGSTPYTISGMLTGNSIAPDEYSITSGSALFTEGPGTSVTLVLYPNPVPPHHAGSPLGLFNYDDLLFLAQDPQLNIYGLLFTFNVGSISGELNLYGNGTPGSYGLIAGYRAANGSPQWPLDQEENVQFHAEAVPEPATFALLSAGFLFYALRRFRRRT